MGFYICDKSSSNYLADDENHSFTNHIGHALLIEDGREARAMLKGAQKIAPDTDLVLLTEVE